jgi:hypothetical protein
MGLVGQCRDLPALPSVLVRPPPRRPNARGQFHPQPFRLRPLRIPTPLALFARVSPAAHSTMALRAELVALTVERCQLDEDADFI